jgi:hypothetical protein
MKIYVASSWRCDAQAGVVARLREEGHEVYDFKNPGPNDHGFGWRQVSPIPPAEWTAEQFREVLKHPVAQHGFGLDMGALKWCDACVLVRPCGRSAHLELGYAVGAGKRTIVLLTEPPPFEPELMYIMCDSICVSLDEVVADLRAMAPVPLKVGDVIRYLDGPTALMRVERISRNHGGPNVDRYYGIQHFGGGVGAYADSCRCATADEVALYEREERARASRDLDPGDQNKTHQRMEP